MAQELPRYPSIGEQFATGLGSGLQLLAQQKLQELQEASQAKKGATGLEALGYTPQEAVAIAQLPPAIQQIAIKEKMRTAQMAPLMGQLQSLFGLDQAPTPEGAPATMPISEVPPTAEPTAQAPMEQAPMEQAPMEQVAKPIQRPPKEPAAMQLGKEEAAALTSAIMSGNPLTVNQTIRDIAKMRQKESLAERQAVRKEKLESYRETKKLRDDVIENASRAKDDVRRLDFMENLAKYGKLTSPHVVAALEKLGIDYPALLSGDTQLMGAVQKDFMRNLKHIFGARPTVIDVQYFLKGIPQAMQSKEGMLSIIDYLRGMAESPQIRLREMNEINKKYAKKHGGQLPMDLASRLETKVGPKLDAHYKNVMKRMQAAGTLPGPGGAQQRDELPSAGAYTKGDVAVDSVTGKRYVHTGSRWRAE